MNNLDPEVAERPEDLVVYGGRGQAARSWEAFDAIIATLKRLKPDETVAHFVLSSAFYAKGDLNGAIGELRTALRLKPNDADMRYSLGVAFVAKGLTKEAAREFREVLRLAPDTPDSRDLTQKAQARLRKLEE